MVETNDVKHEDVLGENELVLFCDSLASSSHTKFNYTIDYFDSQIGILHSAESPTCLNFCVALLREILFNLKPSHEMWDKIKYAAFLLNLATRNLEFTILYDIYHQIEVEIVENNLNWKDKEVEMSLERKMTEKLMVKDDVCSLPDIDMNDSKCELDLYTSPTNYPSLNGAETVEKMPNEENSSTNTKAKKKPKVPSKRKNSRSDNVTGENKKPKLSRQPKRKQEFKMENGENDSMNVADKDEKLVVPCHLCKHKARSQQGLEKHAFEKHDVNRLCSQCGHLSDTYKDFMKHNETHMFTCEVCFKKILGVRVLKQHMKLHETKQETPSLTPESNKVPCDICGVLLQEASLKYHISQVHSNEIHKCDMCDFTANSKYKITDHRNRHFVKMSDCPECGKTVKNLKRHFRRNCGGKKERHFCHLCEKSFSFKESLNKHIKSIHQKIMDHHCEMCEYKTYKKFNLKLHISKMHTKEEMKKVCIYCKQSTSNLEYHIKIYHYDDQLRDQTNSIQVLAQNGNDR